MRGCSRERGPWWTWVAARAPLRRSWPRPSALEVHRPRLAPRRGRGRGTPNNLDFVGNMFDHIPSADIMLLKIMASGERLYKLMYRSKFVRCSGSYMTGAMRNVKILKRCREAIPSKQNGGKVIVIDIVLQGDEASGCDKSRESHLFLDMQMMVANGGMEREEHEWRKIFTDAGFSSYTIKGMGLRSLIE
ncbi:o-methyltransferase, partial [Musa troglodytarum]